METIEEKCASFVERCSSAYSYRQQSIKNEEQLVMIIAELVSLINSIETKMTTDKHYPIEEIQETIEAIHKENTHHLLYNEEDNNKQNHDIIMSSNEEKSLNHEEDKVDVEFIDSMKDKKNGTQGESIESINTENNNTNCDHNEKTALNEESSINVKNNIDNFENETNSFLVDVDNSVQQLNLDTENNKKENIIVDALIDNRIMEDMESALDNTLEQSTVSFTEEVNVVNSLQDESNSTLQVCEVTNEESISAISLEPQENTLPTVESIEVIENTANTAVMNKEHDAIASSLEEENQEDTLQQETVYIAPSLQEEMVCSTGNEDSKEVIQKESIEEEYSPIYSLDVTMNRLLSVEYTDPIIHAITKISHLLYPSKKNLQSKDDNSEVESSNNTISQNVTNENDTLVLQTDESLAIISDPYEDANPISNESITNNIVLSQTIEETPRQELERHKAIENIITDMNNTNSMDSITHLYSSYVQKYKKDTTDTVQEDNTTMEEHKNSESQINLKEYDNGKNKNNVPDHELNREVQQETDIQQTSSENNMIEYELPTSNRQELHNLLPKNTVFDAIPLNKANIAILCTPVLSASKWKYIEQEESNTISAQHTINTLLDTIKTRKESVLWELE